MGEPVYYLYPFSFGLARQWLLRVSCRIMLETYSSLGWPLWTRDREGNSCWHVVVKEERDDVSGPCVVLPSYV